MRSIMVDNNLFQTESLEVVKEHALVVYCLHGCLFVHNFGGFLDGAYVNAKFFVKIRIVCNRRVCAVNFIGPDNVVNDFLNWVYRLKFEFLFDKVFYARRAEIAVVKQKKFGFVELVSANCALCKTACVRTALLCRNV